MGFIELPYVGSEQFSQIYIWFDAHVFELVYLYLYSN